MNEQYPAPEHRAPPPHSRAFVAALTTGSALIVVLACAELVAPAERWPIRIAALLILAILSVIVAAVNGRPEQGPRR